MMSVIHAHKCSSACLADSARRHGRKTCHQFDPHQCHERPPFKAEDVSLQFLMKSTKFNPKILCGGFRCKRQLSGMLATAELISN